MDFPRKPAPRSQTRVQEPEYIRVLPPKPSLRYLEHRSFGSFVSFGCLSYPCPKLQCRLRGSKGPSTQIRRTLAFWIGNCYCGSGSIGVLLICGFGLVNSLDGLGFKYSGFVDFHACWLRSGATSTPRKELKSPGLPKASLVRNP